MGKKQTKPKDRSVVVIVIESLLVSVMVTVICLCILAFLVYKMQWGERPVSVGVIVIYVLSSFTAGRVLAHGFLKKKALLGLLGGGLYFLLLCVLSLAVNGNEAFLTGDFLTTALICLAGGMIGGCKN